VKFGFINDLSVTKMMYGSHIFLKICICNRIRDVLRLTPFGFVMKGMEFAESTTFLEMFKHNTFVNKGKCI